MSKGIDIASWQAGLKIEDAKNAGFEFAILRGGFTGYGVGRPKRKDSSFENFYAQAKKIGLPVGVYYYSCATTRAEGVEEAIFLHENALKGKQFELPIYIDVEDTHWQMNKKAGVTDAIIGFCETLAERGYLCGVYASLFWFNRYIDTARLGAYSKWVAAWQKNKPDFNYPHFDIWQYSSTGKVDTRVVDTDECYRDFLKEIKAQGLNGYKKTSPVTEKNGYTGTFPTIRANTSLKNGSKGEQVKRLQDFLNWYDTKNKLAVDGIFGPKTEAAVKAFQKAEGLVVDGKFGTKSLAAAKAVKR